jgi:hypothetical protein
MELDLELESVTPTSITGVAGRTADSHKRLHDNISRTWYVYAIVAEWQPKNRRTVKRTKKADSAEKKEPDTKITGVPEPKQVDC